MKRFIALFLFFTGLVSSYAENEIYWEVPPYSLRAVPKQRYVYHRRVSNFQGDWIVPLNRMRETEGFEAMYQKFVSKYEGREWVMERVIPSLHCLWNDAIFLSPLHPGKHEREYRRLGYTCLPTHVQTFKIPIECLKGKRLSVWKWFSHTKYPRTDPIHDTLESYCDFDVDLYQEMDDLPQTTKEYYAKCFDPEHPNRLPQYHWFEIPHILCLDPIDISDPRITLVDFAEED